MLRTGFGIFLFRGQVFSAAFDCYDGELGCFPLRVTLFCFVDLRVSFCDLFSDSVVRVVLLSFKLNTFFSLHVSFIV